MNYHRLGISIGWPVGYWTALRFMELRPFNCKKDKYGANDVKHGLAG